MKKIASTLLVAGTLASTALMADGAITAVKVNTNLDKVSYNSGVWKDAKFSSVTLYPQTTIKFNDKKANEMNAEPKAITAEIAAVYNGQRIAFMIKWPDGTKNVQYAGRTDSYADGFAVQFASNYSNPKELPYIGMGSEGRQVVIHLQKETVKIYEPNGNGDVWHQVNPNQTHLFGKDLAAFNKEVASIGNGDYERSYVGEGFRSMTEIKDGSNNSYSRIGYTGNGWSGTLSRDMKDAYVDLHADAIPVAFAIWDGENMGRNGLKYLTGWTSVELKKGSELTKALSGVVGGDIEAGKQAVAENCASCHQITPADAPNLMGPSLTNIGGYASADYIRESMMKPSAVVVPGYNRNAHSAYAWYNLEDGKRVSTMPDFSWLEAAQMDNIVAYLKTLKAEVK